MRSFGQQSSATSALSAPTATCRFLRRLLLESSLGASSKGLSRGSGIVYRVSGFLVKKGSEDYWVWEVQLAPTSPGPKATLALNQGLLGGSWVVIRGLQVPSYSLYLSLSYVIITLLIATHEPPSRENRTFNRW